ncbi:MULTISPECIES: DUF4199 domain-containing protein [Flavobacterium]|uniref:DUF4199 domain-containing protein n=1 Tax=Flavobacterium suzhouense TaxID=1529638 RepID=A0ABW5NW02_9FLAO|nr:DUF4199 domain-containing protein [Flavobacterium sp. AG291]RDI09798.1 uncharacterized protein DUF4199 [Flavobacterium sp. AG291]
MENKNVVQKPTLAKSTLPYGIIFGTILVLEFVVSYTLQLNAAENKMIGVLMSLMNYLVLPFVFILLACNNFKNKLNKGYISFSQSIKAGVAVSVVAALVSSVITSIFYVAVPDAKAQILEQTKISLASQPGMTSEAVNAAIKMTEVFMAPYIAIPVTVLIFAFVGLIISLIVGAIVKKENPYGDYTPNENSEGNE